MANDHEPMIKLEPGGKAPILSYNVPEPTSYSGRNYIEMQFPADYFKTSLKKKPPPVKRTPVKALDRTKIEAAVREGMKVGFIDPKLFPNIRMAAGTVRFVESPNPGPIAVSSLAISPRLAQLAADEIVSKMIGGMRLNFYRSMFGTVTYNYVPEPTATRPRLLLVETYRLSSYLGTYGAGRTIKTFSLLPGERTKISIKTYTRQEKEAKSASSILDSFTQESADEFEDSLETEQSDSEKYSETFEYHAEASAKASWGFGSAKVSGGVKGGSNSSREEFAKNVSKATAKHAAKASAKRDVQINTSFEVKEQTGEETAIEREIRNINVSRTLNFVFRQMNQEFITILHLIDVRVAFFNGFAESWREVPLPELDSLLGDVISDASKRQAARTAILDQLQYVYDYKDQLHSFVEEKPLKDLNGNEVPNSAYLRVRKDYASTYKDEATGTEIMVPGIILSANKYTLRTEGVVVDAILGQGDGLDQYSHGLQDETIRAKRLANELLERQLDREELGQKIVEEKDQATMKVFQGIFPPQEVTHAKEEVE